MRDAARDATRRLRAASFAGVVALLLGIRVGVPGPEAERGVLLVVALGLGYGHLIGALLFGRWRRRSLHDQLLLCVSLLTGGCAFALALASSAGPLLLVPLAVLAVWHTLENDRAIGRADGRGTRLPPLPRTVWPHVVALSAAFALVLAVALGPRFAPWLVRAGAPVWLVRWNPEELIAALLLHHALVWLGRSLLGAGRAAPGRRAAIVAVHALPVLALTGALALGPAALAVAASPVFYLFLSAAHAFHTCFERGLEPG